MHLAPECPRCLRLRRELPAETVGHCGACGRYQYLEQAPWARFDAAVHQHLACVECPEGAWCRDFARPPDAEACARGTHRHPAGQCRPRFRAPPGFE